jgi:anthranilate phosphoribosyltransferase
LFHPALKTVGPIRKNLGVRTFFNMLGPMVNPAFPTTQLVGVYNLEMARIYNYLLQQAGGVLRSSMVWTGMTRSR